MFFKNEKLHARIQELEKFRYRDLFHISTFDSQQDEKGEVGTRPPENGVWHEMKVGDNWSGRDSYLWLKTEVHIPNSWEGHDVVGLFDFGKTGSGNNSGFESLLYVNGQPYQGVDSNHKEVFLSEIFCNTTVELVFRLWSGLEGGGTPVEQEHKIKKAALAWLDPSTDCLYYTAKAVISTVDILDGTSAEYQALLIALDRAFLQVDWSKPGSEAFYQSIRLAEQKLKDELDQLKGKHPVEIRAIGHTHIDVAWLWRLKHTREKAARSFSTVLRLMERFPEYVFLQSQPQLYEYIKTDYPVLYEQMKKRIQEGSWEVEGGMWLEPDCNIPSGESLVRQLLMGTRFIRNEFGKECTYLWLPDVFGYSWALPQILKKSGIHTFMTTKISWNQYNRMPHDTFKWRGIDGTEILTHFITTPTPNQNHLGFYTYNGEILPQTVKGSWDAYQDKSINKELLISYGYGDGGGGVNREMLEMRRRLENMPGLPNVKTGRADEFFRRLHKRIDETDQYVHTWDGELYLEYHRGTYTSQAYNKKSNRSLEILYRETELLGVVNSVLHADWDKYPQTSLNNGWKIILRNQFHDIIPGSSIREVYEDSAREYEDAEQLAEKSWNETMDSMTDESEHWFTVINDASWMRSCIVTLPIASGMESGIWKSPSGGELKAVNTGDSWLVSVRDLPPMSLSSILFIPEAKKEEAPAPFQSFKNGVHTPFYEIEWNEKGQLTAIFDKDSSRDVLEKGKSGNVLQVFEDKPLNFDAWDIDIYYQEKMREVADLQEVRIDEMNQIRTVINFQWYYMDSIIDQKMIVYADNPRIDFETIVDWHEQHQLLKAAFPVKIRSTEATYDIQFGNVTRPTHWNTSWDYARFESVGHQWADLSERGYGVSLLNNCKYGYDIKDNIMRLSLVKSATEPDHLQDQGKHEFTYSLLPHEGDWVQGKTVQHAWDLNSKPSSWRGKLIYSELSLFRLSADHVITDAVKKSEDGNQVILRVHEYAGQRGSVTIDSDLTILSWQECDLMERPVGDLTDGPAIQFDISPYEIRTFLVNVSQ
ncbi:alpha-mannosidase [Virgibacillus siamensis]|uniref:alpha-mannosidase n=1 Tax=Virgibacillus siamensis TaxID=480071 RepID=UPI0009876945|nr:alpha-mannosidase [Virgibacillus siamensis]